MARPRVAYQPTDRDRRIYKDCLTTTESLRSIGERQDPPLASTTIAKIRDKVREFHKQYCVDDIQSVKTDQTNILKHITITALNDYNESKKDKTKRSTTTGGQQGGSSTESSESSYGDPRFLDVALKSVDKTLRMWGADRPPEVVLSGEIRVAGMSPDQAQKALLTQVAIRVQATPGSTDLLQGLLLEPQGKIVEAFVVEEEIDD
tara:strand:+ start:3818 stop:4432 length:615 start_codon:yes stop_codon:yes gene_type:complete